MTMWKPLRIFFNHFADVCSIQLSHFGGHFGEEIHDQKKRWSFESVFFLEEQHSLLFECNSSLIPKVPLNLFNPHNGLAYNLKFLSTWLMFIISRWLQTWKTNTTYSYDAYPGNNFAGLLVVHNALWSSPHTTCQWVATTLALRIAKLGPQITEV